MKYSLLKKESSRAEITCTLPPEEWEGYRAEAERELAKGVSREGFRDGKVPPEIASGHLSEEAVLMETARRAVGQALKEITVKEGLEPVGEPELTVKKLAHGNPFEFLVALSVLPSLTLPDYRKLAGQVQQKGVAVEEHEVEQALEWLRKSRTKEGKQEPELSEEFAKSLGSFENMEEVRKGIREGLTQEKEFQEKQRVRQEILEKIAEKIPETMPEVLVERELEGMLENVKKGVKEQLGMEFPDYLEKTKKTAEQLRTELADSARKRVKTGLALREIAKKEGVEVSAEELEEGIKHVLSGFQGPEEERKAIDPERLSSYTRGVLENEKTLHLLEQQAETNNKSEARNSKYETSTNDRNLNDRN
ncbi:MAG: trigger factor [Patescibacteria group bacterium]